MSNMTNIGGVKNLYQPMASQGRVGQYPNKTANTPPIQSHFNLPLSQSINTNRSGRQNNPMHTLRNNNLINATMPGITPAQPVY